MENFAQHPLANEAAVVAGKEAAQREPLPLDNTRSERTLRKSYLELAPKHWLATRAKLDPAELDAPICSFTIPAA